MQISTEIKKKNLLNKVK